MIIMTAIEPTMPRTYMYISLTNALGVEGDVEDGEEGDVEDNPGRAGNSIWIPLGLARPLGVADCA
jgi:hypothetical protein